MLYEVSERLKYAKNDVHILTASSSLNTASSMADLIGTDFGLSCILHADVVAETGLMKQQNFQASCGF